MNANRPSIRDSKRIKVIEQELRLLERELAIMHKKDTQWFLDNRSAYAILCSKISACHTKIRNLSNGYPELGLDAVDTVSGKGVYEETEGN